MGKDSPDKSCKRPTLTINRAGRLHDDYSPQPQQPETLQQKSQSTAAAKALGHWLSQQSEIWRDYLPLRQGVIREIYCLLELHQQNYSKRVVHKTLRWHTSRPRYINNCLLWLCRFSLNGDVAGAVTEAQQHHAKNMLYGNSKKTAQK